MLQRFTTDERLTSNGFLNWTTYQINVSQCPLKEPFIIMFLRKPLFYLIAVQGLTSTLRVCLDNRLIARALDKV
jgi:hypothetical protein